MALGVELTWRDLLTPEAHKDPYTWACVYAGHFYLALGFWGAIAMGWNQWLSAWVTPLLYLVVVEGYQLSRVKRTKHLIWDSILDTVGVAFGCHSAAFLGNGMRHEALIAWSASLVVMGVGYRVRMK